MKLRERMAIRTTKVEGIEHRNTTVKEHALAHRWLDELRGIELGAAAHNPFGLEGSTHMSPGDNFDVARQAELKMNGCYAEIDVTASAENLPVPDSSQDYIISSHVFEHLPDPIKVLLEWNRVVHNGGYIFMIVPQRDALETDKGRPLTSLEQWLDIHARANLTVDNWNDLFPASQVPHRGHYHVYTPDTLVALIETVAARYRLNWELVDRENPDSKVGNGFTLVYRIRKIIRSSPG
jgi:SAM-dependent methyltransferase